MKKSNLFSIFYFVIICLLSLSGKQVFATGLLTNSPNISNTIHYSDGTKCSTLTWDAGSEHNKYFSDSFVDSGVKDSTTVPGPIVPGIEIGIKIYPNPVTRSLTINLPYLLGVQHYQILDLSGRQVQAGILGVGITSIDTDGIANGLYLMRMQNTTGVSNQVAVMRFALIK